MKLRPEAASRASAGAEPRPLRAEHKTHEHEFRNLGTGRATTLRGMRLARLGIRNSGPLYLLTVRDRVDYDGFRAPNALEAAGRGAGIASSQGLAHETDSSRTAASVAESYAKRTRAFRSARPAG
jgi:hypothetical protein